MNTIFKIERSKRGYRFLYIALAHVQQYVKVIGVGTKYVTDIRYKAGKYFYLTLERSPIPFKKAAQRRRSE